MRGNILASPGVSFGVDGAGGGGALEFADVEAGGVGHGCGVGAVVFDVLKDR